MQTRSAFRLSKWYLDCVSDCGELFIAYVASLRWQKISINYSARLHRLRDGQTDTDTSLRESTSPLVSGSSIEWCSSQLRVNGSWKAQAQPIQRVLLESAAGSIEWNCLQPNARAEIRTAEGRCIQGFGYVEQLEMSIPPWKLPIDELRWGRFLSPTDALVWIDWRGPTPLNLVFHNGQQVVSEPITDHGFAAAGLELGLEENVVIREGPLVQTALRMIPGVNKLFPVRVLGTHECKWLGRGSLRKTASEFVDGWAIHEVVRWA